AQRSAAGAAVSIEFLRRPPRRSTTQDSQGGTHMADPTALTNAPTFLTTMAALSTAMQTFVDHAIKGRSTWLDKATPDDPTHEARRQSSIHLLSFLVGFLL